MQIFNVKTKIKFGEGALSCLSTVEEKKILIITDPFMVQSGAINKITAYLEKATYRIFSEITPDPSIDLVVRGVREISNFMPQVIIALGGGSAIDAAKAMMFFARKTIESSNFEFIAIPTTSGTGSEVTAFSIITDTQNGVKYPLISDELIPDVAILDIELVKTVPGPIVADTGMDVLTHAIESYVSTLSTVCSDAFAQKAVEIVFEYLLRSYRNPDDLEAKAQMHHASCMAGMAFNLTSLGLNHSIAHVIGGKFHIPHGRANAILLPHIIEYNANIEGYNASEYTLAAKKYAYLAKLLGIGGLNVRASVNNLINYIKKLQKSMGMPTTLRECQVDINLLTKVEKEIAQGALNDICTKTNPRKATQEHIIEMIDKII